MCLLKHHTPDSRVRVSIALAGKLEIWWWIVSSPPPGCNSEQQTFQSLCARLSMLCRVFCIYRVLSTPLPPTEAKLLHYDPRRRASQSVFFLRSALKESARVFDTRPKSITLALCRHLIILYKYAVTEKMKHKIEPVAFLSDLPGKGETVREAEDCLDRRGAKMVGRQALNSMGPCVF